MRIIAATAMALLLLLGVGTAGHADPGSLGTSSPIAGSSTTAEHATVVTATAPADNTAAGTVALCALGLLCGMVALLAVRKLFWPFLLRLRLSATLCPRGRHRSSYRPRHGPPSGNALSLPQLGISRT